MIHRDVKPENILLYQGVPMLMDFGIAVAASTTFLVMGFGMGYHLQELLEQASSEAEVVVLEKEPAVIRAAAEMRDLRARRAGKAAVRRAVRSELRELKRSFQRDWETWSQLCGTILEPGAVAA